MSAFTIKNVRFNFVNVLQPAEDLSGRMKYSLMVSFPKDHPDIAALGSAVKTVWADKYGDKKMSRNFLRDGVEVEYMDDNLYFFTVSTKVDPGRPNNGAPIVVDAKLNPITSPNDIYSGCTGNVSFSLYAYNASGNSGVGAGLRGVQVIDKGEPIGAGPATAESMFEKQDGFTRDTAGFETTDNGAF